MVVNVLLLLLTSFFHISGGDHEVRMFNDLPQGNIVIETPRLPPTFGLPEARRNYFGAVKLQVICGRLKLPSSWPPLSPEILCMNLRSDGWFGIRERKRDIGTADLVVKSIWELALEL